MHAKLGVTSTKSNEKPGIDSEFLNLTRDALIINISGLVKKRQLQPSGSSQALSKHTTMVCSIYFRFRSSSRSKKRAVDKVIFSFLVTKTS